jgi:hypothetical protein
MAQILGFDWVFGLGWRLGAQENCVARKKISFVWEF